MPRVIACKVMYDIYGDVSSWANVINLPLHPHVGLGVILNDGQDPDPIEQVFVNEASEIVVVFPSEDYRRSAGTFSKAEWLSHLKYIFNDTLYPKWKRITDSESFWHVAYRCTARDILAMPIPAEIDEEEGDVCKIVSVIDG